MLALGEGLVENVGVLLDLPYSDHRLSLFSSCSVFFLRFKGFQDVGMFFYLFSYFLIIILYFLILIEKKWQRSKQIHLISPISYLWHYFHLYPWMIFVRGLLFFFFFCIFFKYFLNHFKYFFKKFINSFKNILSIIK